MTLTVNNCCKGQMISTFHLICTEPVENIRKPKEHVRLLVPSLKIMIHWNVECMSYRSRRARAIVCMAFLLILKQFTKHLVHACSLGKLIICIDVCGGVCARRGFFLFPVAGYETFLTQIRNRIVCAEDDVQEMVSQACDSMKDRRGPKGSFPQNSFSCTNFGQQPTDVNGLVMSCTLSCKLWTLEINWTMVIHNWFATKIQYGSARSCLSVWVWGFVCHKPRALARF